MGKKSAKNRRFTKQKHIRGDKTMQLYNFGPNVAYYFYALSKDLFDQKCDNNDHNDNDDYNIDFEKNHKLRYKSI